MIEINLEIIESEEYEGIQIIIKCPKIDARIKSIIEKIEQSNVALPGEKEGRIYSLEPESLYYIESVENIVFFYTENEIYESNLKLYEVVDRLKDLNFIQISKSLVVNINHIHSVRAIINGKFEALLTNKEIVIVNRHYVKAFKERFIK